MSGELQTIPARHGVATFVPRGRTVKVINTYGKQVVSMWAFSLGAPPEEDEKGESQEIDEEQVQQEAEVLKEAVEEDASKAKEESKGPAKDQDSSKNEEPAKEEGKEPAKDKDPKKDDESAKGKEPAKEDESKKETQTTDKEDDESKQDAEDPPEQAPDTPNNEKTTENTASSSKQPSKRTWASYLPSIPYRNKGGANKPEEKQKPNAEEEKAQNEANTKKWSSYIPTGKSFSSYVPNVQLPDTKEAMSSFKASHYRDPNKSYAEQLYDFSKTPVGAGTISAATGSGYASSVYAAYSAYASTHPSNSSLPPMEYLSLPHTRAFSHKLVPEVNDELLTNLRNPIITLVEDTSPGAHDTLTAACDANQYAALGVDKPEEHGSCAENLVLALKELNENAGLKGTKAVGADISVNIAPTPLHLFMNAPLQLSDTKQDEGAGAKGTILKVDEPKGKKRSFVRFKAERDVVVVFSSCPMDVGQQNGGRCMAANFMVEDAVEGENLSASVSSGKAKKAPKKLAQKSNTDEKKAEPKEEPKEEKKPEPKKEEKEEKAPEPKKEPAEEKKKAQPKKLAPKKDDAEKKPAVARKDSAAQKAPAQKVPEKPETTKEEPKKESEQPTTEEPKPKKKPRKLAPRGTGSSTPTKSS